MGIEELDDLTPEELLEAISDAIRTPSPSQPSPSIPPQVPEWTKVVDHDETNAECVQTHWDAASKGGGDDEILLIGPPDLIRTRNVSSMTPGAFRVCGGGSGGGGDEDDTNHTIGGEGDDDVSHRTREEPVILPPTNEPATLETMVEATLVQDDEPRRTPPPPVPLTIGEVYKAIPVPEASPSPSPEWYKLRPRCILWTVVVVFVAVAIFSAAVATALILFNRDNQDAPANAEKEDRNEMNQNDGGGGDTYDDKTTLSAYHRITFHTALLGFVLPAPCTSSPASKNTTHVTLICGSGPTLDDGSSTSGMDSEEPSIVLIQHESTFLGDCHRVGARGLRCPVQLDVAQDYSQNQRFLARAMFACGHPASADSSTVKNDEVVASVRMSAVEISCRDDADTGTGFNSRVRRTRHRRQLQTVSISASQTNGFQSLTQHASAVSSVVMGRLCYSPVYYDLIKKVFKPVPSDACFMSKNATLTSAPCVEGQCTMPEESLPPSNYSTVASDDLPELRPTVCFNTREICSESTDCDTMEIAAVAAVDQLVDGGETVAACEFQSLNDERLPFDKVALQSRIAALVNDLDASLADAVFYANN